MNLELSQDQQIMRDSFARFLNDESTPARVRAALPSGFDPQMWDGLSGDVSLVVSRRCDAVRTWISPAVADDVAAARPKLSLVR